MEKTSLDHHLYFRSLIGSEESIGKFHKGVHQGKASRDRHHRKVTPGEQQQDQKQNTP